MNESLELAVLDSLLEPIVVLDMHGVIRSVNAAWENLAWRNGASDAVAAPIGVNYLDVCNLAAIATDDNDGRIAADGIRAVIDGRRSEFHHEYPCHSPHEQRWYRMAVTRLRGSTSQVVISHRNITELKRAEIATKLAYSMLRQVAEEDPVTGLPNRATLQQQLERLLDQHRADANFCVAVLFLELDRITLINDALGYLAGEELLSAFGQRLRDAAADGSLVAHFGNGEFVYVAVDIGGADAAAAIAHRLQALLAAPYPIQSQPLQSSISIGIALWDHDACDPYELLRNAAIALNEARHGGAGSIALFDQTMHERRSRHLRLETALRTSLQKGEFTVLYQPIVEVRGGRTLGADALLRWHHPTLGWVSPHEFLPIAEQTGLIVPMGDWVLCEACVQFMRWQKSGTAAPPLLTIDLSAVQVAQSKMLLDTIRWALDFAHMPSAALQIGIAEVDLLQDRTGARDLAAGLRDLGVQLAITDVALSAVSLTSLRDHSANTLKLPKSFIAGLGCDVHVLATTRSTIRILESLGHTTVATGIDDSAAFATLGAVGCTAAQGSLIARPLPGGEMLATAIALPTHGLLRS